MEYLKFDFNSILRKEFLDFIEFKRTFGVQYNTGGVILKQIDSKLISDGIKEKKITPKFCEEWREFRQLEKKKSNQRRVRILHEFSKYLYDMGYDTYVAEKPKKVINQKDPPPYIFNKSQLGALFKASENLDSRNCNRDTVLICLPILFRTLYATGLRISECLNLKIKEVSFDDCVIFIRKSKNGKQRKIPFDNTLKKELMNYLVFLRTLFKGDLPEYLFVKGNGEKPTREGVLDKFKKCLDLNEIEDHRRLPRIHDLRHTFAVHSMHEMILKGMDTYNSIAILGTYMGHGSTNSTQKYIRFVEFMYPKFFEQLQKIEIKSFRKWET